MSTTRLAFVLSALALFVAPVLSARADDDAVCTQAPPAQWLSVEQIKAKATELGYAVRSAKTEGSCIEVYAIDPAGARVEAYFDPATGEIVRKKVKR